MRFCLSGTALTLILAAGVRAGLAATTDASPADLRADISRLQAVVAGCAAATGTAPAACAANSVGDDLKIGGTGTGGYEVHWDWLRDGLDKSETAEAGKRAGLLSDSTARLSKMSAELDGVNGSKRTADGEYSRARMAAASVLARPEFVRDDQPTWWDKLKARLQEWLFKVFSGVERAGASAPWIGPLLEWLLFAGAAVGLLFFLLRNLSRQRLRVAMGGEAIQTTAWDREAMDWSRLAEEFASQSKWRDAVHCLYWAAIVTLEAKRSWRHNPTRTPREYLRLLKPGSAQQRGLRGLTRIFERVWYGLREARAEEYREARGFYEGLAAGRIDGEAPEPAAVGKVGLA
jgi:hypothetical protein